MRDRLKGYLFLTLAMVGVGSTAVASKVIAGGLPPLTATALRMALALPIFMLLMRLTGTSWPRPGRRDGLLLLLQAASGSVGYMALLVAGTGLTSAADAGVILGTLPAVAALTATLLLGERPHVRTVAAIALATAGVLAVTAGPAGGAAAHAPLGNALVLAAVVCESFFILLNKRLRVPVAPLALSATMTGLGLLLAAAAALALERPWSALGSATPAALAGVAYYALVPTVAGFLLWYAGAARTSGSEAALCTAVAPVSSLVLAATLLHEPLTLAQLLGAALVLAAVGLAAMRAPVRQRKSLSDVLGA